MTQQLDLLDAARTVAGECEYGQPGTCTRPATHVAHGHWVRGPKNAPVEGDCAIRCCLRHANYYATAWCPHYPGQRDSAWIEILPEAAS